MIYKSEDQLKKALEIDSWRNLSRDKMIRFAAMMPEMDKELALKIVDQFPEFKRFALDALDVIERRHEATLTDNRHSQDTVYQDIREIRSMLERQKIMETGKWELEKDSENKRFLDSMFGKVVLAGAAAVALGVAFVGGKVVTQREDSDES
jgi:hypothetical protein